MKGSHNIIVETERMKYEFTIRRNVTVILGDSATGKTTLVEFLNMFSRRGKNSGVTVTSDVPCVVFSDISGLWQSMLEEIKNSIVFIDEGQDFIFTKDFAKIAQASSNYYVLITRRPLYNLPYSTKEIYGIRTTGKYHFPEKVYQEFYPVYSDEALHNVDGHKMLHIIFGETENANYGPDWFKTNYDPEWLKDAFVQKMIKDIDKSDYVDGIVINSPILGPIPPERLSGGVQTLIMIYEKPELVFDATSCGENCAKWLLEIGKEKDITVNLNYLMKFSDVNDFEIFIDNENRLVTSIEDYIMTAVKYV